MTMRRGRSFVCFLSPGRVVATLLSCLVACPSVAGAVPAGEAHPAISASAVPSPGGVFAAETRQGDDNDGTKLVLEFEARSNRLTSSDQTGLDRLAAALAAQPNSRLTVFASSPGDLAARHFMASRLAAVEQELSKRGITADTVTIPRAKGNDVDVVLWMAPRALPRTPLEMLPAAAVASPQASDAPEPGGPLALLPEKQDDRTAQAVASAEAPPAPAPVRDEASAVPPHGENNRMRAAATADVDIEELWVAAVGQSLRTVLKDWGGRAGWTIVWQSDREYPIDAAATFSGDFTNAASQLFNGFATAMPAPSAHFYKGNRVLLVESGEGR